MKKAQILRKLLWTLLLSTVLSCARNEDKQIQKPEARGNAISEQTPLACCSSVPSRFALRDTIGTDKK